jgi:signal transduction histidine kinase
MRNPMMNKLLLIDDERPIIEMLDLSLTSEGYEVFTAENGNDGMEIFEREKPKLVITDIKMPGMDGLEVLKKIRESGQEAEVIIITGHGDMGSSIAALQNGASDFITKPIKDEALMVALKRAKEKNIIAQKLRDHTEILEQAVQKRTEELRRVHQELIKNERLATIGETVTGLAHYIKNILNGLRGGMYKINSGMNRDKPIILKDGWEMAQRNVEKISDLVLDLLSYSKERTPQRKRFNPNEIVLEIVESLHHLADDKGVKLSHSLDSNIRDACLDPKGIHRILLNLVSNAIDACIYDPDQSKSFEVKVNTRIEAHGRGKDFILFEVIDNGCGMNREVKQKLFNRFFSTKKEQGTGLGLLITHKIIQEHGGEISVDSEEGKGATFRVRLEKEPG